LNNIQSHIDAFKATTLDEMNAIKLLNRIDTKYVFNQKKLTEVLHVLKDYYYVLEIDGKRIMSYENEYFDTKDFLLYNKHQRGMLNRTKVRIRKYVDSNLSFIELKRKNNKSRTIKNRIVIKDNEDIHTTRIQTFLETNSNLKVSDLQERLYINFQRITLAHKNLEDRCTLDINLEAHWKGKKYTFENLAIAELKQEKFRNTSDFNLSLKKLKIHPGSFSKYCFSFFNLNPNLKKNNFNKKNHLIKKILK